MSYIKTGLVILISIAGTYAGFWFYDRYIHRLLKNNETNIVHEKNNRCCQVYAITPQQNQLNNEEKHTLSTSLNEQTNNHQQTTLLEILTKNEQPNIESCNLETNQLNALQNNECNDDQMSADAHPVNIIAMQLEN